MLYTCHAGRVKKEAGRFEKVVTEVDFDGCNVTLVSGLSSKVQLLQNG